MLFHNEYEYNDVKELTKNFHITVQVLSAFFKDYVSQNCNVVLIGR